MITGPAVGATSTIVLEGNVKGLRKLVVLANDSDENIYVCPGAVAQMNEGIPLLTPGGSWTDTRDPHGWMYQGPYHAICTSGGKVLCVTELS